MDYTVKISDDALESMALAAIEAYCLGDGRSNREERLETLGYIWGHRKCFEDYTIIYVSKIAISISAIRSCSSVQPNPEAAKLKDEFVSRWSPHLTLLGDFHTHPYADLDEVNRIRGFEFSPQDFEALTADDHIWNSSDDMPLMLAMTICRLKKVRDTFGEQTRNNVCSFSVGEFRFWLNAAVGYIGENSQRTHTGNTHSRVFLDLNSRFFNMSGDRIQNMSRK